MSNIAAIEARAEAFVRARLAALALPGYPGAAPVTLAEAYAIQDHAIRLWPDTLSGWKVGRINAPWDSALGCDRLVGPIFSRQVAQAGPGPAEGLVFKGGFGAVEGEVIIVAGADAPDGKLDWSLEEAAEIAGSVLIGAEIASSPFPGINDDGPLVTISDFGNHNGLILGPAMDNPGQSGTSGALFRTLIDGIEAGRATPAAIPGGPLESFRALLEIVARRGLPLRKGMYVSTGAVTGVHPAHAGQTATIEVDGREIIHLSLKSAAPAQAAGWPGGS
ncbi:MAG: 2-keto-4-pentenoate hydratase [Hyphomonas sp.]